LTVAGSVPVTLYRIEGAMLAPGVYSLDLSRLVHKSHFPMNLGAVSVMPLTLAQTRSLIDRFMAGAKTASGRCNAHARTVRCAGGGRIPGLSAAVGRRSPGAPL
jgi:hypothetical protein